MLSRGWAGPSPKLCPVVPPWRALLLGGRLRAASPACATAERPVTPYGPNPPGQRRPQRSPPGWLPGTPFTGRTTPPRPMEDKDRHERWGKQATADL